MNKKIIGMCSGLLAVTFASMLFVGGNKTDWKTRYDTSLPDLNSGSWKETLHTDFTKIENMEQLLAANWAPSPHVKRNVEYWCDDMLEFTENGLIVHSEQRNNHNCDVCGVSEGIFTGGIETRRMADGKSEVLFAQAYGYFEATVLFRAVQECGRRFGCKATAQAKSAIKAETAVKLMFMSPLLWRATRPKQGRRFIMTLIMHRGIAVKAM